MTQNADKRQGRGHAEAGDGGAAARGGAAGAHVCQRCRRHGASVAPAAVQAAGRAAAPHLRTAGAPPSASYQSCTHAPIADFASWMMLMAAVLEALER